MVWNKDSEVMCVIFFFFFEQKTANDMRISDWSSDVCSSVLLSLALTYNLCEAMQGQLTITSEAGFGSQFCADLPLPRHTAATPVEPLRGHVVAITDRSSGLAELLNMLLPGWGLDYERRSVDDGLLGLKPDILITDCPECLFNM